MDLRKDYGFKLALFVFLVLFLLDVYSTLRIDREIVVHLESNPLFLILPSFLLIIVLNVVFMFILWWMYAKYGVGSRFMILNYMVWLCFIRFFVVLNNFKVKENVTSVEQAQAVTVQTKVAYSKLVALTYFIPLIVCGIIYLLFKLDHIITRKKK